MGKTLQLAWLLAALALARAAAPAAVPPMIYNRDSPRETPVWVSADQAILDDSLRWELFRDLEIWGLEKSLALLKIRVAAGADPNMCTTATRWFADYRGDAGDVSLEGVYRVSTFAVMGEVVGAEVGFFGGTPSTLLEIEVDRTVLPEEKAWKGSRLFASYPEAQVPLAGGLLCGLGDRKGVTPAVGSRILVFSPGGVEPDRYPLVNAMDNELFFEIDDGDLSVPVLGPGHPETWEELEQRLARLQGRVTDGSARGPLGAAPSDGGGDVPPASWGPPSVEDLKRALAAPPARPPMAGDPELEKERGRLAKARGKTVALILDLNDDGVRTVSLSSAVEFDINADGIPETTSWTFSHSREAFLGLDLDGDGQITTGRELFGAATELPDGSLAPHSFAALAVYDGADHGGDGDSLITVADAVWPRLLLWVDGNHDGKSQPEEVSGLDANDVVAISLVYRDEATFDGTGNIHRYQGQYVRRIPRRGREPKLVAARAEAIVFRAYRPQ